MVQLLSPFWNDYPCVVRLRTSVKGINDITKIKGDEGTPWNIPRLIFTSKRLIWPDINVVFQSVIVDLMSEITLAAESFSFKAMENHVIDFIIIIVVFLFTFGMASLDIWFYLNSERRRILLRMKIVPGMDVYCKYDVAIGMSIFVR